MPVSGTVLLLRERSIVWRNLCMIGERFTECIVEFSETQNKFYICAYDISCNKYHIVDLFKK
jgi:hypothetical protein